jgi:hypothetical protein
MMLRRAKARAAKAVPVVVYEEKKEEKPEEKQVFTDLVTKAEVEKMKFFALKSLATKNGIEVDGKNTADLKKEIIEKLNL